MEHYERARTLQEERVEAAAVHRTPASAKRVRLDLPHPCSMSVAASQSLALRHVQLEAGRCLLKGFFRQASCVPKANISQHAGQ